MKKISKTILASIIALTSLTLFSACENSHEPLPSTHSGMNTTDSISETENTESTTEEKEVAQLDEKMPAPFDEKMSLGGDENAAFYQPCNHTFDRLPVELSKLRNKNEVDEWINSVPSVLDVTPSNISEYKNMYSFITNFEITKEEAENALSYYLNTDDEDIRISREDFDLLFSGDIEAITHNFASEYSIVVGENIYCPNWIYTHSVKDYEAVGITAESIAVKATKYSDFNLADNARIVLSNKLSSYTGETINLEPTQSYEIYQPSDFVDNELFDEAIDVYEEEIEIPAIPLE